MKNTSSDLDKLCDLATERRLVESLASITTEAIVAYGRAVAVRERLKSKNGTESDVERAESYVNSAMCEIRLIETARRSSLDLWVEEKKSKGW